MIFSLSALSRSPTPYFSSQKLLFQYACSPQRASVPHSSFLGQRIISPQKRGQVKFQKQIQTTKRTNSPQTTLLAKSQIRGTKRTKSCGKNQKLRKKLDSPAEKPILLPIHNKWGLQKNGKRSDPRPPLTMSSRVRFSYRNHRTKNVYGILETSPRVTPEVHNPRHTPAALKARGRWTAAGATRWRACPTRSGR